ncbi:hypothetical protein SISSUDRAFT_434302 [Sistotremastrum suecicum HHB10207 ss-3]|uniref:Uncharacterized protein n=1 Tax=Sistotremastrum suecicum HHB10207 ss-3 TaxID=1314776 RepID=A0A165YFS9_9AGAM|nr:hypothetical protein SISSUDRAFT_434302 [Sistotremastrum suecicum HHB10207 ss-3]
MFGGFEFESSYLIAISLHVYSSTNHETFQAASRGFFSCLASSIAQSTKVHQQSQTSPFDTPDDGLKQTLCLALNQAHRFVYLISQNPRLDLPADYLSEEQSYKTEENKRREWPNDIDLEASSCQCSTSTAHLQDRAFNQTISEYCPILSGSCPTGNQRLFYTCV